MSDVVFSQDDPRIRTDAALKRERVREFLDQHNLEGVLISRRDNFAWVTSGGDNHVLKNSEVGVGHIAITRDRHYLLAHSMDAARLYEEQVPGQEYELVCLNWFQGDPRSAAVELVDGKWAADTDFNGQVVNVNQALSYLHYPLTELEMERCRWLGEQVGKILCRVALEIQPGQKEDEVANYLCSECLKRGIELDVLIVGSDERIFHYRHPLPTSKKIERYVLIHPAARRWGLHANVSRSVYFGTPSNEVMRAYRAAAELEACLLERLKPGLAFSEIFNWQKEKYAELGFPEEWKNHFQGGPTGYVVVDALRHTTSSKVQVNQAFDWFITVTGGKVEELALLSEHGVEIPSFQSPWPSYQTNQICNGVGVPDLWVL